MTQGRAATFTGEGCYSWAGGRTGEHYAAQGNILSGPDVIERMAATFEKTLAPLVDRLLAALAAGQAAGGDKRGQQSAALLVVRAGGGYGGFNDRYVDLRVDDHLDPIGELHRLLAMHKLYMFETRPEDLVPVDRDCARQIQNILRAAELYAGDIDGRYDRGTRDALRELVGRENLEGRWREDDQIDRVILEYLATKYGFTIPR